MKNKTKGTLWLVWSHEHGAYWRSNSNGYATERCLAGRYSFEEALEIARRSNQHISGRDYCAIEETICPDPDEK